MRQVAVSVIVPTRNRAALLSGCLEALSTQSSPVPYEVIVVDNGSEDATPQLLDTWTQQDARVVAAIESQPGRSRALNVGIRRARGTLLLFTDDDTLQAPDWIASYWRFFASHPGEMMAGGPIIAVPDDGGRWPRWVSVDAVRDLPGTLDWEVEQLLRPPRYVWGGNVAVPASVFARIGLWNEALGHRGEDRGTYEDLEFQDRLRSAGGCIWFVPRCAVSHRMPRRSVTPRRILRRAMTRGANDYWRSARGEMTPRVNQAGAALSLAWHASRAIVWSSFFRIVPSGRLFDEARRSIRAAGWTNEELTHSRRPLWHQERFTNRPPLDAGTWILRRATSAASRLAERAAPGRP